MLGRCYMGLLEGDELRLHQNVFVGGFARDHQENEQTRSQIE